MERCACARPWWKKTSWYGIAWCLLWLGILSHHWDAYRTEMTARDAAVGERLSAEVIRQVTEIARHTATDALTNQRHQFDVAVEHVEAAWNRAEQLQWVFATPDQERDMALRDELADLQASLRHEVTRPVATGSPTVHPLEPTDPWPTIPGIDSALQPHATESAP